MGVETNHWVAGRKRLCCVFVGVQTSPESRVVAALKSTHLGWIDLHEQQVHAWAAWTWIPLISTGLTRSNVTSFSPGDYCEVNLCHNGGTCVTGVGDDPFICICADGFGGDTCNLTETGTWQRKLFFFLSLLLSTYFFLAAVFAGPCSPNPCKNDGLCEVVTPTRRGDVFNEYICKCQPGFEGVHCQTSKFPAEELLVCVFMEQSALKKTNHMVQIKYYM